MNGLNAIDQEQVKRIISNWKLTPATFAHKVSKGAWIPAPWLMYAASRVAAGIARGGARIIISAPPRHGKTELIAINTSAWVLENFANRNVILTGYGADLVEQSARRVRAMFWENEHLLSTRIPRETSQVGAFLTTNNGYMFSVGLGGAITGRGAHVLVIDDYIKEIKEALSPATRDYIWNWFVTTAMTRLEPGASVIIIATRWHSDDLIGRILKNFPGQWENICLPALATKNDLLGRQEGEPLFPERYPAEELEARRELLGSVFFHALYQQGPVDEILKVANADWLQITSRIGAEDFRWARIWDLAATDGAGDYTTGSLVGHSRTLNQTVVANIIRRQLSPEATEALVRNTATLDGTDTTVGIEQEPGSSGKALVNHYATNVLPDYRVVAIPTAGKSKLIRAQPMLAAAEAGKIVLFSDGYDPQNPETMPKWIAEFKHEFNEFPAGQNDDQVDTVAAAYTLLTGKKPITAAWGRTKKLNHSPNSRTIRRASFMLGAKSSVAGGKVTRVTFGSRRK